MKLQVGKKYKTAEGRTIKIITSENQLFADENGQGYYEDGRAIWFNGHTLVRNPLDIIEEI